MCNLISYFVLFLRMNRAIGFYYYEGLILISLAISYYSWDLEIF